MKTDKWKTSIWFGCLIAAANVGFACYWASKGEIIGAVLAAMVAGGVIVAMIFKGI